MDHVDLPASGDTPIGLHVGRQQATSDIVANTPALPLIS
jgi:hypothetical protein